MANAAQNDISSEMALDAELDQVVTTDYPPQHMGTEVPADQAEAHEAFLGIDSYGWVGLSFVVFVAILWKVGAFRAIGAALDAKGERVRSDLAEAASLRAEAEALKAKAATDAAQAQADARAVIENATAEAERIITQAALDADAMIARRGKLAEDRIAAEARSTEAEIRARAAEITVRAGRALLAEKAAQGQLAGLADSAISGLDRR